LSSPVALFAFPAPDAQSLLLLRLPSVESAPFFLLEANNETQSTATMARVSTFTLTLNQPNPHQPGFIATYVCMWKFSAFLPAASP
jgi:hypothetical protein